MNKYIFFSICFFSTFLSVTPTWYRPMTKRTINFPDDVCHYRDISDNSYIEYVKPCEEGKHCQTHSTTSSDYQIYTCVAFDNYYDNKDQTCDSSIACTSYTCNSSGKCGICQDNQIYYNSECISDPGFCKEYDSNENPTQTYVPGKNKNCAKIELQSSDSKTYSIKKLYSNYLASIEDGDYIESKTKISYCKSGFALYFYGNGKLKNPNTDNPSSERMFLRCVTVLGRDRNGIIKYKIGNGDEMYYDPDELKTSTSDSFTIDDIPGFNDQYFMFRIEMFQNIKDRLDSLDNCRETNCQDDELIKWRYFYSHPDEYLIYQNEPQVMEYLIQQTNPQYKAQYTSSTEGSILLNVNYLALLSLLFLL